MMTSTDPSLPQWQVQLELAVPTIRPQDHKTKLDHQLHSYPDVLAAQTSILGRSGKYQLSATLTVTAGDATTAGRLARHAIQHACAAARLPTGTLASIKVKPQ